MVLLWKQNLSNEKKKNYENESSGLKATTEHPLKEKKIFEFYNLWFSKVS